MTADSPRTERRRFRPLDRIPSIKLKFGITIVVAVAVSAMVSSIGFRLGVPIWIRPVISAAIALALVQVLARGMTSPLRAMAAAARKMAQGDLSERVETDSLDEVGELARAFNGMAADLERVHRVRRDLVANVSHELRTPISALQARLENLVDGVDQPDPELLGAMLGQVERLGRLVAQLLDLARYEAGVVPLHQTEAEIRLLFADAIAEARLQVDGLDVRSSVEPPDLTVQADHDRLLQVVVNLLTNAVRHSPPNAPIDLRASTDAGTLRLEVEDRGPGIAPEEVERVFQRFYRADPGRSSADGGVGLGLSIARWIVELHGGTIAVEPGEPSGCRMVVTIPRQPARSHLGPS